jgi:hypothetical protein
MWPKLIGCVTSCLVAHLLQDGPAGATSIKHLKSCKPVHTLPGCSPASGRACWCHKYQTFKKLQASTHNCLAAHLLQEEPAGATSIKHLKSCKPVPTIAWLLTCLRKGLLVATNSW